MKTIPRPPVRRRIIFASKTKSVEWLMAAFMLGWALTLAIPGSTFSISSYRDFVALGIKEEDLATFFFVVGILRAYTLWRNGTLPHGPEIRFFCSAVGAFTWLLTAMLFTLPVITLGSNLPVSAAHGFVMFIAELYAIGVAAFDRTCLRR